MRNSTPVILWVLIFSFGILWVLQDTQVFDVIAGGPANLGSVNGDPISVEEYNSRVSYYVDQFSQQTNSGMSSEMRSYYEEQAWEDLVAERLMAQKMEELGIVVTDDELVNMITGENPDPFIRQQFEDEEGNIDRIALRAAIEAPENQEIWIMVEQQLRQNRQQQKLTNFIMSSLQVGSLDIERAYKRANSYADIRFVRIPYSDVSDEEITVTEGEISDYYNRNREQFHRDKTWQFRYVSFDKTPTREDTLRIVQDVEELGELFAEAEDPGQFLQRYQSSTRYNDRFVAVEDLREEYRPLLDLEPGEVSGIHIIDGSPHMFKKVEERDGEVKFAILSFPVEADPVATVDRVAGEADDFSFFAGEEGFEEEAGRQALEIFTSTATEGTPVAPGIGEARPLLRELEGMRRGDISGEIELQDRFVVVQVTEVIPEGPRPLSEVRSQIENILRNRKRTSTTIEKAEAMLSSGGPSLEEFAEAAGKEVQSADNIRWGGSSIPGAGREPGIIGAVFGLSEGDKSRVLEGNSAAFVVEVEEISIADASEMDEGQRRQFAQEMEQMKFMLFSEVLIDQMKEDSRIQDNRHRLLVR